MMQKSSKQKKTGRLYIWRFGPIYYPKTLPIKDTLFLSPFIFFGVNISLFFNPNQDESQQKKGK